MNRPTCGGHTNSAHRKAIILELTDRLRFAGVDSYTVRG